MGITWRRLIDQPGALILGSHPTGRKPDPTCIVPAGPLMGFWVAKTMRLGGGRGGTRFLRRIDSLTFRAGIPNPTGASSYPTSLRDRLEGHYGKKARQYAIGRLHTAWGSERVRAIQKLLRSVGLYEDQARAPWLRYLCEDAATGAKTFLDLKWHAARLFNVLPESTLARLWPHHWEVLLALAPAMMQYQGYRDSDGIREVMARALGVNRVRARRALRLVHGVAEVSPRMLWRAAEFVKFAPNWNASAVGVFSALNQIEWAVRNDWIRALEILDRDRGALERVLRDPLLFRDAVKGIGAQRAFARQNGLVCVGGIPFVRQALDRHQARIQDRRRGGPRGVALAEDPLVAAVHAAARQLRLQKARDKEPFYHLFGFNTPATQDGWTFTPLTSVDAILAEAEVLQHCVEDYVGVAATGSSFLLAVEGEFLGGPIRATIEIALTEGLLKCPRGQPYPTIWRQCYGFRNRTINPDAQAAMRAALAVILSQRYAVDPVVLRALSVSALVRLFRAQYDAQGLGMKARDHGVAAVALE